MFTLRGNWVDTEDQIRAKAVVCFLRHLLNDAQDVARVCFVVRQI